MLVRIQISFKTIKLGERKEDLTAIKLSETYSLMDSSWAQVQERRITML